MTDYKIYTVYHDDSQLNVINNDLNIQKNINHYELYPNHKNVDGINLNYLHDNLNEFCAIYYVWKNNKYNKYIGFNQYKRHLLIDENMLSDDICYVHTYCPDLHITIKEQYIRSFGEYYGEYVFNTYISILNDLYGENNKYSNFLINSTEIIWDSIFLMSYVNFVDYCNFVFTVYDRFNEITNINYDLNKCIEFYKGNNWYMRAHMLERLSATYILNNFKKENIISKCIDIFHGRGFAKTLYNKSIK